MRATPGAHCPHQEDVVEKSSCFVVLAVLLIGAGCGGSSGSDGNSGTGGVGTGGAATGGAAGAAAGSGGGTAGDKVGIPCASASECPAGGSGETVCLTDWPGGYCAVKGCEQHGHDCPNDPGLGSTSTVGGKCVLAPEETCLALCATKADCRDGYDCLPKGDAAGHGSANVCVPAAGSGTGGAAGSGGMGSGGGGMGSGGMSMDGGGM